MYLINLQSGKGIILNPLTWHNVITKEERKNNSEAEREEEILKKKKKKPATQYVQSKHCFSVNGLSAAQVITVI